MSIGSRRSAVAEGSSGSNSLVGKKKRHRTAEAKERKMIGGAEGK